MKNIDEKFIKIKDFNPPEDWLKITSLDCHTGGEPLRIITSGLPKLEGNTILEKRRYMKENFDHLRTALMWEPRGHADQYGAIITESSLPGTDFGVIFMHNEGYSTMCGHAIIALTKIAVETGMIEKTEPVTTVKIEAPAGLITSYANVEKGKVKDVYFHNVPSFILLQEQSVFVDGLGDIKFDVAYGGAFYAFVKADDAKVEMNPESYRELIEKGMAIKKAVMENYEIKHPYEKDLSFLYGTIFYGAPLGENSDSRNVCIFADGEVDRSPTGTGVSARMALHYFKGELGMNEPYVIESILNTRFTGKVIEKTNFGKYKAVIPEVKGTAYVSGKCEFYIDPEDTLQDGFILR